jgi:demethylmenaquinone methyltransferase/2-methoxy-6-polyprenyl-1,4-benzoquinol methylase
MAKFDHFSIIGSIYDKIFGRGSVENLLKLSRFASNQFVLDLGGGTGRVAAAIKPLVQSVVVGDSALGMLKAAQIKDVAVLMTASEFLPAPGQSFDRVIMVDAFHHLADQQLTLKEMWRVLSPGGMIVIEEPDISNFWVKWIAVGEKVLLMRSHFLRPEKIAQMAKQFDEASVTIKKAKGVAWIIITKLLHERGETDGRN